MTCLVFFAKISLDKKFQFMWKEVRFASFLSCGFTTMAVINPPEKKLAKCTSVQCCVNGVFIISSEIWHLLAKLYIFCHSFFSSWL